MLTTKENKVVYQQVLDVCLTAGRLMIEGGSEMYRVEDTMKRIALNAGMTNPRVFATPTGVFMSLAGGDMMQLIQVRDRNINLELVDRVNELSREFARQEITLDQLENKINRVAIATPTFPIWLQVLGAAILSPTLMVLFTGKYDWIDFPAAAVVGAIGYLIFGSFKRWTKIRFLSELIASAVMGLVAIGLNWLFPQLTIDYILIGALMTLVPGLALTNALRDLFMGDLVSGVVRGVEAALTAVSLGAGVAIVIRFFGG